MSNAVVVRKVENRADFKNFFEFPWTLYKDDPNWVPPLLSVRRLLLDKAKSPSWSYMEGDYFTAWRGDKIVGTIAALINHRHNEFHKENVGWFGTFEVYDDAEAATALLNTAADWVKAKGYDAIRGPQNFTTHEECGLLVDNFTRPVLLMPYNYPYYARLVEGAGFHKVMDVYSFYYDRQIDVETNNEDRLNKLVERLKKRNNITIRQIDSKNLKAEFALFKELYNAGWEKNWGFVPMTDEELDALVESLGQFFDPSIACFAEVDGQPAGFMLGVPDFNQVLWRAYPQPGHPEIFTLLKALWHWKIRPIMDCVRVPLMGVKAEYRNKGLDVVMYHFLHEVLGPSRYQYIDSGWILEANRDMVSILQNFGAKIYKTHRFYEKKLIEE
jgi:GNAT superfamily N-acetyltransferase